MLKLIGCHFHRLKSKGVINKDIAFPLPWKKRSPDNYHFYKDDEFNTLEKCQTYVDKKGYLSKVRRSSNL